MEGSLAHGGTCALRSVFVEVPGVFAEAHIEPPAEGVFQGPMASGAGSKHRRPGAGRVP
ncbi:MAG: hypothetical protein ACJ73N_17145 [Bryobacteraceae bacterium]